MTFDDSRELRERTLLRADATEGGADRPGTGFALGDVDASRGAQGTARPTLSGSELDGAARVHMSVLRVRGKADGSWSRAKAQADFERMVESQRASCL